MQIEEQPYDLRHNTPPRREGGPLDRNAEMPVIDAWGKSLDGQGFVKVAPGVVSFEFTIPLNPDEELSVVVNDLIAEVEVVYTGAMDLMWRSLPSMEGIPRIRVQGEPGRVAGFRDILEKQNTLPRNGWIKRRNENYGYEWLRVVWLESPASSTGVPYCEMIGCGAEESPRWAIAYKVAGPGLDGGKSQLPIDNELMLYCQSTVMSDNDVATFIEEAK